MDPAGDLALSSDRCNELLGLLPSACVAALVVNERGIVDSWNAGAESLVGWSSADIVGHPLSEFLRDSGGQIATDPSTAVGIATKSGTVLEVEIHSIGHSTGPRTILIQDVTEKKFLEEALFHAIEKEQRRLGQELHDHLCQHLLGAAFSAKALAGGLDKDNSPRASQLHELARLINDAVCQVRDISRGLEPVERDPDGLRAALHELANRTSQIVPCSFVCDVPLLVENPNVALSVYRIAQEVVTSAQQETGATNIIIRLSKQEDQCLLVVEDDGRQPSELNSQPLSIAAKTLKYRAKTIRGNLSLTFNAEHGSRVECLFPQ